MPAPPPREPGYPTGRCDSIAPGMNGIQLRDDETPDAYERIGTSVLGQPIWAEYYGPATPTSVVLVIGQVHGNECAPSRFVRAVRAMQRREYGVWLIPTLDPDGYAWYSRYNITGRDLNTDGWTVSQPETRALMAFTAKVRPVLTVHVHSPNGQIGWYGLGSYVPDDPGRSGAVLSGQIAQYVAARSGLEMAGAGSRSDRSRWLLWQGQRLVHPTGDSLLVEVHAVADSEVPFARPRPATQPVAVVDAECQLVLAALDRYLGS